MGIGTLCFALKIGMGNGEWCDCRMRARPRSSISVGRVRDEDRWVGDRISGTIFVNEALQFFPCINLIECDPEALAGLGEMETFY